MEGVNPDIIKIILVGSQGINGVKNMFFEQFFETENFAQFGLKQT